METFPEVSSQMLQEFEALLKHSPSPIGDVRLLQLLAINMFAIDNATTKAGNDRSQYRFMNAACGEIKCFDLIANHRDETFPLK